MFDYEVLRFIWWLLIGLLLIGFAVTDGFDLGVGILLLFIGKTNIERRIMINSIAPHWDGNQVWLVTAVGAIFAAWPIVYAAAFSCFYIAILLVLSALFFRPVGLEYRSKIDYHKWRTICDYGLFIGSFIPPLVFGMACGNLLQGIPFLISEQLQVNYIGSFFYWLNPYSILVGIISIMMVVTQGSTYLQLHTVKQLYYRSRNITYISAFMTFITFIFAGIWLMYGINGYAIKNDINTYALSNPLNKEILHDTGVWMLKYYHHPMLCLLPLGGLIFPIITIFCSKFNKSGYAFLFSSLTIVFIILTFGVSMFPFVLPSSMQPNASLTIWDSSSSLFTLQVMTIIASIFIPTIIVYTIWCYYKMFIRLDKKFIENNKHSLY